MWPRLPLCSSWTWPKFMPGDKATGVWGFSSERLLEKGSSQLQMASNHQPHGTFLFRGSLSQRTIFQEVRIGKGTSLSYS